MLSLQVPIADERYGHVGFWSKQGTLAEVNLCVFEPEHTLTCLDYQFWALCVLLLRHSCHCQ